MNELHEIERPQQKGEEPCGGFEFGAASPAQEWPEGQEVPFHIPRD